MVDLELDDHIHRAALHLPERASWEDLKGFLEDAHANLNNTTKLDLCRRFDQHKEWQREARARQSSPLTASPTTRTETSPLRPSSTRGTSPAISQIEQPQFINPVSMKDSANPKIYDNRTIEVVYRNDSNETNLIAEPACKLFGHEVAEIGQNLPIYYTPKGEKQFLKKMCVVRPWGKGEGEICTSIIFARERSKSPHLNDGLCARSNLPMSDANKTC
ncbi:hypothetical protein NA56DRAFT_643146 [Hyaloscypha hepaticicola]|uniref:Uncharacterized protein n=1 Tax=Hyaloscypha hepaticicola TaxID=2082293 RepID=A0A2J6QEB8_9HELO|nr:hypothetical protein NA56DRAFT_643146 [Hyaloscypha hepaticicola]